MSKRVCPYCNRPMPSEAAAKVRDEQIVEALKYPGAPTGRGGRIIRPWLYAAADAWDSRLADKSKWFVTGPVERRGYIKGPFSHEQVKRVATTGKLKAVCEQDGEPIAYELA